MIELSLVESATDKTAAQARLQHELDSSWKSKEIRDISFRPRTITGEISHDEDSWHFTSEINKKARRATYWNAFGRYKKDGSLQIDVEINIPLNFNDTRVSGFFARDPQTQSTYLLHSGGIGGGRLGVGKFTFLNWLKQKPVKVLDSKGHIRSGIVIGRFEAGNIANRISHFRDNVAEFKGTLNNQRPEAKSLEWQEKQLKDFYDEFSGKKKRRRIEEIEYYSRHGDVVRALREWRNKSISPDVRIGKNILLDLAVEKNGFLSEVYEVKSGCERQNIHSAIGQILVHDKSKSACKRFVVLPYGNPVAKDLSEALSRLNIHILRYRIAGKSITIES